MVNWNDPTTLANQFASLTYLNHLVGGIYLWEIVLNLHHDWELIKNPSKGSPWVKLIYIACRYFALGAIIAIITAFNVNVEINCNALAKCVYVFSYFSSWLASVLVGIRVMAIWNYNRLRVVIVVALLCALAGVFSFDLTKADAIWSPETNMCQDVRTQDSRLNVTITPVVDIGLLLIMLQGLLRWEPEGRFGLWRFLWNQGLVWVLLAVITEVPILVFLWLNLNQVMNLMLLLPGTLILIIGATRIYRNLSQFTNSYQPGGSYFTAAFTISSPGAAHPGGHAAPDSIPMQRRAPWKRRQNATSLVEWETSGSVSAA